mmetsp:Transcript_21331/g.39808  ORF Transcript_21331/g.39808 Transcript_21331/m.39808 type:complete len:390 (-) Transcript_21331:1298-2467(-)|eukprot:CAMPEP_0178776470 /NCGR_PEP_ID=MMETSP0744-20121128/24734_1 /TAXON_ID=913974 /ORGANISM="Nitzschia punctata, Strain CCMP561" /LENGTH=389 /DNA_ID=CAMNT_0020433499 /DNA_START=90 /DNA_END=1259 /DNA_ORIENTATION=-
MTADGNAGVAFGLVMAAGASTGLGAAVVFFPSLVKLASRRVLASSLGFSAGVMTYVSFMEIQTKAMLSFQDAGHDEDRAYIYATVCFFGGVVAMLILNVLVAKLLGGHHHHHGPDEGKQTKHKHSTRKSVDAKAAEIAAAQPSCCSPDPVLQLKTFKQMASVLEHERAGDEDDDDDKLVIDDDFVDNPRLEPSNNEEEKETKGIRMEDGTFGTKEDKTDEKTAAASEENHDENIEENKRLQSMGLNTALAIGFHNFPEGLATFVAALEDPKVGVVLAVAIAIHNIPEGLCVALPIYYATGNRLKAFLWALLSGASEVVAAFLGWLILVNTFSDTAYAVLFGLVAGMMVIISIRELLPTAHFYDPEDTCVTFSFIGGMALMALSLVLFKL